MIREAPPPGEERAECSDEDLLMAYREHGDREAFGALVHRYERGLFCHLRRYLGDEEAAEDVFQQTFLQVHLKCDKFDPGRRFRPWLYAVATNQAIDYQRQNRRHDKMLSLDWSNVEGNGNASPLKALAERGEQDPVEVSRVHEIQMQVQDALAELENPLQRDLVKAVYFRGRKYREAANDFNIPEGTVKSRLHTALKKLRSKFSGLLTN